MGESIQVQRPGSKSAPDAAEPKPAGETGPFVKSAARVLAALEFFQHQSEPAQAKDIRAALMMAKSSTSELLQTLVGVGYLTFNPETKTYLPSFRLAKLGMDLGRTVYDSQLPELMQELADVFGETVSMLAPDGRNMQFVGTIPGPSYSARLHKLGVSVPILESAAGRAYLATRTDTEAARFLQPITRGWPAERRAEKLQALLAQLAEVRRDGFAVSAEPFEPGESVMVTAIDAPPHHVPLVIGIGGAGVHAAAGNWAALADRLKAVIRNYPNCRLYFELSA